MAANAMQERGPLRASRTQEGRILGGVCAGLPDILGLGTNGLRLVFVLAALCGGIGIVLYMACWLVIPTSDEDPQADGMRGVAVAAWGIGGLAGFILFAAGSAAATAVGLGWVVFALAALGLVAALSSYGKRIPPAATLLVVIALTLPAIAVALSPARLSLRFGNTVDRPATAAAVENSVFRGGFGTLLIDLRSVKLPASGVLKMTVHGGLRRTIVALPSNQCVHVQVQYNVHTFVGQLATLLSGHRTVPFSDVVLFGRLYGNQMRTHPHGFAAATGGGEGPTLTIDFSSQGGGLYVRDYPDTVSPDDNPSWPGFVGPIEPRPHLQGEPRKVAAAMLSAYNQRVRAQQAHQAQIQQERPGPCYQ